MGAGPAENRVCKVHIRRRSRARESRLVVVESLGLLAGGGLVVAAYPPCVGRTGWPCWQGVAGAHGKEVLPEPKTTLMFMVGQGVLAREVEKW